MTPILLDLNTPFVLDFEVWFRYGEVFVAERGRSSVTSSAVPREHAPRAEMTVSIASWLQDWFSETAQAWGHARPVCPGHTHPAKPMVVNNDAWWVCPDSTRPLAGVGQSSREP